MKAGIYKRILMRALWQSLVIVFIVVPIAILVNWFRADGLALKGDWSSRAQLATEPGQEKVISLEKAREAFFSKKAVFLDARPAELYNKGHIRGARNLPEGDSQQYFDKVIDNIPKHAMIITYCDGESCPLSKDLAKDLFFRGYDNVYVLENGWSRWVEVGLPVAKGRGGNPAS